MDDKKINVQLYSVFLIASSVDTRSSVSDILDSKSIPYNIFTDGNNAINELENITDFTGVSCIISDICAIGIELNEFIEKIKNYNNDLPIILLGNSDNIYNFDDEENNSSFVILPKPINSGELYKKIVSCHCVYKSLMEQKERIYKMKENIVLLTNREKIISKLLATGQSSKEIAIQLNISNRTVDVHRLNIIKKLGAKSVVDLVGLINDL